MNEVTTKESLGIIYGMEDKPPLWQSAVTAAQHLLSMAISIGAPPLLICQALQMPPDITVYLVNMSFFTSGIGTFIQTNRIGPFGSGLLNIQATSFIFPMAFIAMATKALNSGKSHEEVIALMTGATIMGSIIQMILSRMTGLLNRVFTPLVCGITVTMVGLSLLNVAMGSVIGSPDDPENYAAVRNILLGFGVLVVIVIFNAMKKPMLRMSAMIAGFAFGLTAAYFMGILKPLPADIPLYTLPMPLKYGIDFNLSGFISIALLYVIVTVEVTGDLSATSMLSLQPTKGPVFVKRLQGGILGGALASTIAGLFNSFPTAIFAQNSGVIQLTGNASRHVGKFISLYLLLMGLFPIIGACFHIIPSAVLGGALILLFGLITTTGLRLIFSTPLSRRSTLIIAVSLGLGVATAFRPDFLINFPEWLQDLLHSSVAVAGISAIVTNLVLPNFGESAEMSPH